jgi:hypothetical protein
MRIEDVDELYKIDMLYLYIQRCRIESMLVLALCGGWADLEMSAATSHCPGRVRKWAVLQVRRDLTLFRE